MNKLQIDLDRAPDSDGSAALQLHELRAELSVLRRERDSYRRALAHDPATGLYNRRHFDERLAHEWQRALHFWSPLSLLVLNLDEPHLDAASSEKTVCELGRWLGAMVREIDIACRVGPESLAVILPATGRLTAEAELERLRSAAEARLGCAVSFGMAIAFDDAHTPLELFITADDAAMEVSPDSLDQERHETIPVPSPSFFDGAREPHELSA